MTTLRSVLLFTSLLLQACGGSDSTPCEKADALRAEGMLLVCQGQDEVCFFCSCFNQGLQVDSSGTACEPAKETTEATCSGIEEEQSLECLDDEEACRQLGAQWAMWSCQAEYLMESCQTDEDCAFDLVCHTTTGFCSWP